MIHNVLNLLSTITDTRKSIHFIVREKIKQLVKKHYKRRTEDHGLKASRDMSRAVQCPSIGYPNTHIIQQVPLDAWRNAILFTVVQPFEVVTPATEHTSLTKPFIKF